MPSIVAFGTATRDIFFDPPSRILTVEEAGRRERVLALDYPAKIYLPDAIFETGGGATNTAVSFARFGLETRFCGKLGDDDDGEQIIKELEAHGVDCSTAVRTARHRTGFSVILTSSERDRTVLCFRGANDHIAREDIPWERLREADWLYISSLSGSASHLLDDVADFAEAHGVNTVLNPGSRQIAHGLDALGKILSTIEIVFLNRREALALAGERAGEASADAGGEGEAGAWAEALMPALKVLKGCGPGMVVVTHSRQGSCVYDGEQLRYAPACEVEVVSALGAGDAYCAAFAAAVILGDDVERAMRLGSANAASVVQTIGAKNGILTYEQAVEFVREHSP
ncbi:MAG: carbohydrate kinase family protein [Armatimonadota bacterium]